MKTILILDTETSSLDPSTGHLLEVAVIRFSVEHATELDSAAWLVKAPSNEAEHINGIPVAALDYGYSLDETRSRVAQWSGNVDAIVAHSDFDQKWIGDTGRPWIDSCNDLEYPRPSPSRSLAALCLAHGLGVSEAHRAMADCRLLVRLFERCHELGHDLDTMLRGGLRPKGHFVSLAPFEQKDLVKQHGFRWDATSKHWWRKMAIEDAGKLPFRVQQMFQVQP